MANPSPISGRRGTLLRRELLALPFFLSCWIGFRALDISESLPDLERIVRAGSFKHGAFNLALPPVPYVPSVIDALLRLLVVFFSPAIYNLDPLGRAQSLSFLMEAGVIFAILYIESTRASRRRTLASLPTIFILVAQLRGFGAVSGPFYAFDWIMTSVEDLSTTEKRQTDRRYTATVLPVLALTFYLPLGLMYFAPTTELRYYACYSWQFFSVFVSIAQFILAYTIKPDRTKSSQEDLPAIRLTMVVVITISAVSWVTAVLLSGFPLSSVLIPLETPAGATGLADKSRAFLQWDELLSFGNVYLWLAYGFSDLKSVGMITQKWTTLLLVAVVSTFLIGPGATTGLFWGYREYVLAYKTDKHVALSTRKQS